MPAITEHSIVCPVSCPAADGSYRYIVNQPHNYCEDRKCQPTVGNHAVDLIGSGQLLGFILGAANADDGGNINITLIGDNTLGIIIKFVLQCFDLSGNIRNVGHLLDDLVVLLQKFDCEETFLGFRNGRTKALLYCVDSGFHIFLELMNRSYILFGLSQGNCFLSCFLNAGSFQCGDLYNLAAQFLFQFVDMYLIAGFLNQVHHVDGHDYGDTKLHNLCGQIQVTLNVGTINDVDDSIRSLVNQIVSGYNFLKGVGREGIDSRKVHDDDIFMTFQFTFFLLYGYAGPVTNKLVGSCQRIK